MNYRIASERAINVTASGLAMVAQRLPLLKNLTPIFGATGGSHFAAPLAVTSVGTHALSGQSIMLQQTNTSEPTGGIEIKIGEAFQWEFKTSRNNIRAKWAVNQRFRCKCFASNINFYPSFSISTVGSENQARIKNSESSRAS